MLCAQVFDEGLREIRESYAIFLLYGNVGTMHRIVSSPCLSTKIAENLFWAVIELMEHFIGAGHVRGVAEL